jgi:hypothetical protein
MRIRRLTAGRLRRLALGLSVPLILLGGVFVTASAQAATTPAAESTVGDPALPNYPGLPYDGSTDAIKAFDVTTTAIPCADNGSDQTLTRSKVLTRARSWLAVGIPYSQLRCYRNQYGDYRTDCSGFVSMSWGVGGSGSSHWTGNMLDVAGTIARGSLQPGDALLRHTGDPSENHVALFVQWSDSAHTEPVVIEQTGSRDTVEDTWSESYAGLYTPIRYDHITDDPAPTPHGPVWGRDRSAAGVWDSGAKQTDTNPATTAIAGSVLPDGTLFQQVLIPGSGVWDRARSAAGVWDTSATHTDTNPASTDVASAVLPDGTLHQQVLVPGSGVWDRARHPDGTWDASAQHIDTNGATTAISSTVTPDGTLWVQMLIPGSGLWSRSRAPNGTWTATSTHVDTNPASTDTTAAALPDGSLHYFVLVPGSGVWDRVRHPDGTLDSSATHVDTNPSSIALSSTGLPNGGMSLAVTVPGSGVWVRGRSAAGVWESSATHIDSNGDIFDTYSVGLPNGTIHIGDAVNVA